MLKQRRRDAASQRKTLGGMRVAETPDSEKSDYERFYGENSLQPRTRNEKRASRELRQNERVLKKRVAELEMSLKAIKAAKEKAERAEQRLKAQRRADRQRARRRRKAQLRSVEGVMKRITEAKTIIETTKGKDKTSRMSRRNAKRKLSRAQEGLTTIVRKQYDLVDIRAIGTFQVVFFSADESDDDEEEEEEKKQANIIYKAVSDANLSREQMRSVIGGVKKAGVTVSGRAGERFTHASLTKAAKELKLALSTNGTIASPLPAVGSSLEFQHMTPSELANGDLSLVMIYSYDAWPAAKGTDHPFLCSTFGARVTVVRRAPDENMLSEVVSYGFTDTPGAIAVFARLVGSDREQLLLHNDGGIEDLIGRYNAACGRGESFSLTLKLHGVEVVAPVRMMWRCFDAKAAQDFSDNPDTSRCFLGCGWRPGVGLRKELLLRMNFDKTKGKSQLSRLPPLVDTLHFVKNYGANAVGLVVFRFNRFVGRGRTRRLKVQEYALRAAAASEVVAKFGVHKA